MGGGSGRCRGGGTDPNRGCLRHAPGGRQLGPGGPGRDRRLRRCVAGVTSGADINPRDQGKERPRRTKLSGELPMALSSTSQKSLPQDPGRSM